jgi:N-acetylneuraminic acid mutarotase
LFLAICYASAMKKINVLDLQRHSARFFGFSLLAIGLVLFSGQLAAQMWTQLPSVIPEPRDEHASCAIGQYIYILGGEAEQTGMALADNLRYDSVNDSWATVAPMPTARKNAAAVALGGKCYVIGGRAGTDPALAVVEIYDPAGNSWSAGAAMPTAREGLVAAVIGGLVYAAGGESNGYLDDLEVYDPVANAWISRASMRNERSHAAAGVIDGKLYVAGGTNAGDMGYLDVLEVYDPGTNRWSTRKPMPEALFHGAGAVAGKFLYVTGGIGAGGTVARTWVYNAAIDFWAARPSLTRVRNRHVMEKLGSKLFAVGGAENVSGTPHLTTDTLEALEVGADFTINSELNDAWVSDGAPYQGLFITVFESTGLVFVSWFTFDSDGPSPNTATFGSSDQRWVTGAGAINGDTVAISAELTSGGIFNGADPVAMQQPGYGTITIVFKGCNEATFNYDFPSASQSGQMNIRRVLTDNVGECEAETTTVTTDPEPEGLKGITSRHNEYRATVGVPPMEWDTDLAAIAQGWAETCTDGNGNGLIDHNSGRSDNYQGQVGENIYGNGGNSARQADAVDLWAAEEANYDIVNNTCSGVCGHWTQMVWEETNRIGCGKHICPGLAFGATIVCNYAPSGNINNRRPYTPPE